MSDQRLVLWSAHDAAIVPREVLNPPEMIAYAVQLSGREHAQIVAAFNNGSYEMVSVFVWTRAIAALRRRLSSLGMDFIGQMLGRPDIDEHSSIEQSVTEFELIGLAADLGIFSPTVALRLKQAHELITHFSQQSGDEEPEGMAPEEAIGCLRTSIESILGHDPIELPKEFIQFRQDLELRSFRPDSSEITHLRRSPPFFKRVTVSLLLSLLKTTKGAAAEHGRSNVKVVLPAIWDDLPKPLRWQIGQTYAELHNEGRESVPAARALKAALMEVKGFDFVPETLRSSTYSSAAEAALEAHGSFDNFALEIPAMRRLESLGTSIPMPAFPIVMTACLSIFLGNRYGFSFGASPHAEQLLGRLSGDRWQYYLAECLPMDRSILSKLHNYERCRERWFKLLAEFPWDLILGDSKKGNVQKLLEASLQEDHKKVKRIALTLYKLSGPSTAA